MIGISVYPYKEKLSETLEYVEYAGSIGVKKIFTNLLGLEEPEKYIDDIRAICEAAKVYDMEVTLDVAPYLFERLNIEKNNAQFFLDMGIKSLRLDSAFDGFDEAMMTYLNQGLNIEMNMSYDNPHLETVMSYVPRKNAITACHNFYPQRYTGLSLEHFITCSNRVSRLGIRTAAFVNSNEADHGPHVFTDGLCTLEMHRDLDIVTQAKHLMVLGTIDDIIVANAYASKEELDALVALDPDFIEFRVHSDEPLSELEHEIVYNKLHFNRGDTNDYLVRSTFVKLDYKTISIPKNITKDSYNRGDLSVGNDSFGQYKGEVNIVKKPVKDLDSHRNYLGSIIEEERFLIDYIKPWSKIRFKEV